MVYTLFLDESVQGSVFGLGGFIVRNSNTEEFESGFANAKARMGVEPGEPLKWSLSTGKELHQKVRRRLAKAGITPSACRQQILELIAGGSCTLFASLHEETRATFSLLWKGRQLVKVPRKRTSTDFYRWAFQWILQRLYFFLKDKDQEGRRTRVVIDKPPTPRHSKETLYHEIYRQACDHGFHFLWNDIPPLKECVEGTLSFSYADHSPMLQLADFCIGASVYWSLATLAGRNHHTDDLFRLVLPKFYRDPVTESPLGYGIIIYPPQGSLRSSVPERLGRLEGDTVQGDEALPF